MLFCSELDFAAIDEIRQATNGNHALGSDRFQQDVGAALGRRRHADSLDVHLAQAQGLVRGFVKMRVTSWAPENVVCPRFPRFPVRASSADRCALESSAPPRTR